MNPGPYSDGMNEHDQLRECAAEVNRLRAENQRHRESSTGMSRHIIREAGEIQELREQVAAVHAALDQYEADKDRDWLAAAHACVATVAKAVDR